jgi:predicted DNA-binding antitoxin AbrB/MazE fold protein
MSRFTRFDELKKIDLGDGDWVKVPSRFSFKFVEQYANFEIGDEKNNLKKIGTFLTAVIKQWNLKDPDGKEVEVNAENIADLDLETSLKIAEESMNLFKSLPKV